MIKKIMEFQQKHNLIEAGDRVVVGFSGGADSVCLLLVLEEMRRSIDFSYCAVHVEHGIRGEESLSDAAFAEAFCKDRDIEFFIYSVDAPKAAREEGVSLEEAARKLRYECFEQARVKFDGNKIAVAHHGDDNGETMLFHMVRGTGLKGLGGIPAKREYIIRPLLAVTRREIVGFLAERQQDYCVDSTNAQVEYSRNRIRNMVMPQLELLNIRAVEHMSALSQHLAEVYEYVAKAAWLAGRDGLKIIFTDEDGTITEIINGGQDDSAEEFFAPKQKFLERLQPNWCLDKEIINGMEPLLQREFLHQVLGMAAGSQKDISGVHVESLQQLFGAETGKQVHLPYRVAAISRYQDVCLRKGGRPFGHGNAEKAEEWALEIDMELMGEEEQLVYSDMSCRVYAKCFSFDGDCEKIPQKTYTKWFDYDKINNTVFLRNRRRGDYLMINQQGNQKKLKEYFINEKIPKEDRDQQLLLAEEDHVMWVVGYRISEGYKVIPETKRVLQVRVEKEN